MIDLISKVFKLLKNVEIQISSMISRLQFGKIHIVKSLLIC